MPLYSLLDAPELREYDHSLVKTGNLQPNGDGRWENGVGVSANGHYIINGVCTSCAEPGVKGAPQTCEAGVTFYPYLLEFGVQQMTGDLSPAEIEAQAVKAMLVGTSARLEDLQNTGCTGSADTPMLSDGTALGSGTTPTIALGRLVAEFYNADAHIGAQGTIYMSPLVAASLGFDLIKEDSNGVMRVKFGGHKVVIGNYPTNTMYGHLGDVDIFLSEVVTYASTDLIQSVNMVNLRVERLALAVWDTSNTWKVTIS